VDESAVTEVNLGEQVGAETNKQTRNSNTNKHPICNQVYHEAATKYMCKYDLF